MLSSANLRFTYFSEIYFTQNVCLTYGWDGKIGSFLLPEKVLISESHICFCNVAKKKKKKSSWDTALSAADGQNQEPRCKDLDNPVPGAEHTLGFMMMGVLVKCCPFYQNTCSCVHLETQCLTRKDCFACISKALL